MSEPKYRKKGTVADAYTGLVVALVWWFCIGLSVVFLMEALADPLISWLARLLCLCLYFLLAAFSMILRWGMQYPEKIP